MLIAIGTLLTEAWIANCYSGFINKIILWVLKIKAWVLMFRVLLFTCLEDVFWGK